MFPRGDRIAILAKLRPCRTSRDTASGHSHRGSAQRRIVTVSWREFSIKNVQRVTFAFARSAGATQFMKSSRLIIAGEQRRNAVASHARKDDA
jgi:hypothetical protein